MSLSENQGSFDNKAPEDSFSLKSISSVIIPIQMFTGAIWLHEIKILFAYRTINWLFSSKEMLCL